MKKTQASQPPSLGVTGTAKRVNMGSRGSLNASATGSMSSTATKLGANPKKMTVSQQLEAENKKMEEKLKVVQQMMELEGQKRTQDTSKVANASGSRWRSAGEQAAQSGIRSYGNNVVKKINIQKGSASKLPPTSKPVAGTIVGNQSATKGPVAATKRGFAPFEVSSQPQPVAQPHKEEKKEETEEYPEVLEFLSELGLEKYKDRFIENGIEDEETILELNDLHLDGLKIPLGHKLKILKRVKTIRQDKGMTVPESRQGNRPTQEEDTSIGARKLRELNGEMPTPSGSQMSARTQASQAESMNPQRSALKQPRSSVQGQNSSTGTTGISTGGNYNEQESAASFQDALNEWRRSENPEIKKAVRFQQNSNGSAQKKPPAGSQQTQSNSGKKKVPKTSCWSCYKLIIKSEATRSQIVPEKEFCSLTCVEKYEKDNLVKCMLRTLDGETCDKKFTKHQGLSGSGKWFCSEKCGDKDEDILEAERQKQKAEELLSKEEEDNDASDTEVEL